MDRHPLRSPSPSQPASGSSNPNRPGAAPRRPSAVASEWKAIGAGLAGLFGGSNSTASSSSYQWPADPASSGPSIRPSRRAAAPTFENGDDDDEAGKGRPFDPVESTLVRLEDWFGLKDQQQQQRQSSSSQPSTSTRSSRPPTATTSKSSDPDQVRVLIHPVAPTDTLHSLALHYGADIQVLRKSNKLWPGDPVQIRQVVYIPVDSCKHRPPNAEIRVVNSRGGVVSSDDPMAGADTLVFVPRAEEEDLLTGTPYAEIPQPNLMAESLAAMRVSDPVSDFMPDTNKAYNDSTAPSFGTSLTPSGAVHADKQYYPSSLAPSLRNLNQQTSTSSPSGKKPASSVGRGSNTPSIAASASAASSGFVPPRQPLHVAKVPVDQLKFFASEPKPSASGSRNPGPGDIGYRPGESGIDDLLAMAAQPKPQQNGLTPATSSEATRPDLSRSTSFGTFSAFGDDEEEWKPNTWHFGSAANRPKRNASRRNRATVSESNNAEASSSSSQYQGWNDAPPPDAIVARAYDGGKAYRKRQAQKSHPLLYDLAAGLPANPGAASKWARPIQFGDSLPGGPPGAVNGSAGASGNRKSGANGGIGKLIDDTIRGRISVEAALGGAFGTSSGGNKSVLPRASNLGPPPPRQLRSQQSLPVIGLPPPPPRQQPPTGNLFDPLSSPANAPRSLEQSRKIDWAKGKDD